MRTSADLIAFYCLSFALTGAVLAQGIRLGLEPFWHGLAWPSFFVCAVLLFAASAWIKFSTTFRLSPEFSCLAVPLVQFMFLGLGFIPLISHVLPMLGVASCIWILVFALIALRGTPVVTGVIALIAIPAFATVLFNTMATGETATPLLGEAALMGAAHPDSLFKTAYAHIWQNYGVLSTGVDGLTPLTYHAFDGIVYSALAQWLGVEPIEAFGFGLFTVFIPLFLASAGLCVTCLRNHGGFAHNLDFVLVLGLIYFYMLVTNFFFIGSESTVVASIFFLTLVPAISYLWLNKTLSGRQAPLFIVCLFVTILLFFAKVSYGLAALAALTLVAFFRMQKLWQKLLALLCSAAVLITAFLLFTEPGRADAATGGRTLFSVFLGAPGFVMQIVAVVVLCWIVIKRFRTGTAKEILQAVGTGAADRATLLLYVLGITLAPALLFSYVGADFFYFLLPAVLLGVSFLASDLSGSIARNWPKLKQHYSRWRTPGGLVAVVAACLIFLPAWFVQTGRPLMTLAQTRNYLFSLFQEASGDNRHFEPALVAEKEMRDRWSSELEANLRQRRAVWAPETLHDIHERRLGRILATIRDNEMLLESQGQSSSRFLVFLPADNIYWTDFPTYWVERRVPMYGPTVASLQIPALSGHPLIFGLPDGVSDRGFEAYDLRSSGLKLDTDVTDLDLCQRAAIWNFGHVLRFSAAASESEAAKARLIKCS